MSFQFELMAIRACFISENRGAPDALPGIIRICAAADDDGNGQAKGARASAINSNQNLLCITHATFLMYFHSSSPKLCHNDSGIDLEFSQIRQQPFHPARP